MTGRVVVVTGTSTGVGKTIATAALAARAAAEDQHVVVVKPVQTGATDADPGDVEVVHRLTGCAVQEYTALDDPLAPETAARRAGVRIPSVSEYADRIRVLAGFHDLVLVEGAGGLLVRLDSDGGTMLDLAADLKSTLPEGSVEVVLVVAPGLGTLNHTELTVGALRARGLEPAGLVVGFWPQDPGLAERCNLEDLPRLTGVPLLAVLPEAVGRLDRESFRTRAPGWFRT